MAITLVTNPVGSEASKFFAGLQKCELIFKREDIAITGVESGSGGIKINLGTDLSGYLTAGDTIYLYSEGTDYTYDQTGTILAITANDITISGNYIQNGTGGYINYLKNYFIEVQCVDKSYPTANLLPFNLQSDGDAAGNIQVDVSIMNELNDPGGSIEFEIQYRQVYTGSSESFTLVDNKLFVICNTIDVPVEGDILNHFDEPCLFLGYPANLKVINKALAASGTMELTYNELDFNKEVIVAGTLGSKLADFNGFISWTWAYNTSLNEQTEYVQFNLAAEIFYDFLAGDFAFPDFRTEPIWYNVTMSQVFTRNNCGGGYTPTSVEYTVPAGTYSSQVSQAAANALAQDDIDLNGQDYANANGYCSMLTFECYFDAWHTQDGYQVPDPFDLAVYAGANPELEFAIENTYDILRLVALAGGTYAGLTLIFSNYTQPFEVGQEYNVQIDVANSGSANNILDFGLTGGETVPLIEGHNSFNIVATGTSGIFIIMRRNLPCTSDRISDIDNLIITKV